MKRYLFTLLLSGFYWALSGVCLGQAITHEWKSTAVSSSWNDGSNWDAGTVPNGSSNVKIVGSNYTPTVSGNLTINHLNIGGSINIGSHTITASQSVVSSFGFIQSSGGKLVSPHAGAFNFTTVQGNISLEFDTGVLNGSNVFENALTLQVNSPTSFLVAASRPDHYKGPTTFINNGSGGLYLAAYADAGTNPTTFEGSFTFINNAGSANFFAENDYDARLLFKGAVNIQDNSNDPNGFLRIWKSTFEQAVTLTNQAANLSFRGGVVLAGQVYLNGTGGTFGFMGSTTTNSPTLVAATGGIQVGSSGLSGSTVLFDRLAYQSNGNLNLLLGDGNSHSSVLTAIQTTAYSNFTGKVNFRADYVELNGSTFQSDATFERTGPNLGMSGGWNGNGNSAGGNTFNGSVLATNHSGTNWKWGVLATDVFNGDVVFRHGRGAASQLNIAQSGAHLFKGNLTLQSTPDALSSGGITVGHAGDTTKLAVGKQLSTTGFLGGYIKLHRFRQLGFTNPQTVVLPPTATLQLEQVIFDSQLTATAGHLEIANSTFRRPCFFTKTATGIDFSNGSNLFYRYTRFTNNAPAGSYLQFIAPNDVIR